MPHLKKGKYAGQKIMIILMYHIGSINEEDEVLVFIISYLK